MKRLLAAGVATGFSGMVVLAGVLLVVDPFDARKAAEQAVAVSPPPADGASAAPPGSGPTPTGLPSAPPVSGRSPSAAPTRSVTPTRSVPSRSATSGSAGQTDQPRRRVDAARAAAIVTARFEGARVVEAELEDGQWELTFLLDGVENEIRVDRRTGRLSGHERDD
jgi:hypothetical protein